jgi:DNA-binding transcriptional LysR family regulator
VRIEQLEYLDAVVRAGSLSRASEALHISPSGLSETIRNLERELGVDLLTRGSGGAVLNELGREVMPTVRTVLEAVAELRDVVGQQREGGTRRLVLGTVNAATASLLAPSVREFREGHPEVEVEVVGSQPKEVERGLLAGRLDLGLVTMLEGEEAADGLEAEEIVSGGVLVCLPPDHELAERDVVGVDDLLASPFVALRSGYLMHRLTQRILGDRTPPLIFNADSAEMVKFMVAEGLGPALLPDFCVVGDPLHRRGALVCRPLAGPPHVVRLAAHRVRARQVARPTRDLLGILRDRGHELLSDPLSVPELRRTRSTATAAR